MNNGGDIVVIEDDHSAQFFMDEILSTIELKNKVRFFSDSIDALEFLKRSKVSPFIIFSDVNLPKLNGFEIKAMIDEDQRLRALCIPFIFYSTGATRSDITQAYYIGAQGYFQKAANPEEFVNNIKVIISYWSMSFVPQDI